MRDHERVERVEGRDGFVHIHYENGEIESICIGCFETAVYEEFRSLEKAERIHACTKILKPWGWSVHRWRGLCVVLRAIWPSLSTDICRKRNIRRTL
jgi:hypothetical protein